MQLTLHPYDLPLRDPFRISHGSRTVQPTLIVKLTDPGSSTYGLGEIPLTSYYGLNRKSATTTLTEVGIALAAVQHPLPEGQLPDYLPPDSISTAVSGLHRWLDQNFPELHPFYRCGLDVAYHDLLAKRRGLRLGSCWPLPRPDRRIPTCYTIGMGTVAEMSRKITAFPWPIYKIKLGPDHGPETIAELRKITQSPFRIDANTGWTAEQTLAYAPQLAKLGVEYLEQPLPPGDTDGQARLFRECPLPIFADESCQTEADVERCAGLFHGINVKVVKCGGLLPARRMLARGRMLGLKLMAGCMTESSIGISAIAQLVPLLDYVDIDGALLLASDPARGVTFDAAGMVRYPDQAGTGALLVE